MEKIVKIKKITKLPVKHDRYDLTVSTTNNFYANGILIHNTSHIFSNCLVKYQKQIAFYKKLWNLVSPEKWKFEDSYLDYGPIWSSRTVIKNQYINTKEQRHYYDKDVWSEYGELLSKYIPKGMSVYSEIAGYVTDSNKMIQKGYDYGCERGENFLMPYRITTKEEDGSTREWNVLEVKEFTEKLIDDNPELDGKIRPITVLYHGTLHDLYPEVNTENHWHENVLEEMKNDSAVLGMELSEPQCNNVVPREGVVLRIDDDPITEAFKLKSLAFLFKEGQDIDNGEVDMEMSENYG